MSLAVTTASKSMKEAQNTLTPVILLISALAGVSLIPGISANQLVPMVPYTGQIVVSQNALTPPPTKQEVISESNQTDGESAALIRSTSGIAPLLLTLFSSVAVTWVLLRGTTAMLADEDLLFRGPDAASGFSRPAPRLIPGIIHGGTALALGLAGLWYVQGLSPDSIVLAIPVQQLAVVAPLAILLLWQRVNIKRTFAFLTDLFFIHFESPLVLKAR